MGATLTRLEEGFGSLDAYLDWIGFDAGWRARLAETFVEPAAGKAHEGAGRFCSGPADAGAASSPSAPRVMQSKL